MHLTLDILAYKQYSQSSYPERILMAQEFGINTRHAYVESASGSDKLEPYEGSSTEILFEEICCSFGTNLEKASINPINGAKLVRLVKPTIIIKHPSGERHLVAFQYSRISPLISYHTRIAEIYRESHPRARRKSVSGIIDDIYEEIKVKTGNKQDPFPNVTDNKFMPSVMVGRWPKAFYAAIYNLGARDIEKKFTDVKPFTIHEITPFEGRLPDVQLSLVREPLFCQGFRLEDASHIYDTLTIAFPLAASLHTDAMRSALALHPLQHLNSSASGVETSYEPGQVLFRVTDKISSKLPRTMLMGLFASYIRKFAQGTTF